MAFAICLSWGLGMVDEYFGITDRVVDGLDDLSAGFQGYMALQRRRAECAANEAVESLIDYAVDSARHMVVKTTQHYLRKYLPRT